ncbi:NEL-type E3 ubiquitin ligase domain-containing protein [Pseudomonas rossensis]|uniref:NEL-type E3 ubiquitin ligase domain-containing protein n=1 Tax=Pseudomonas rossensis TaxID=2305471 RepID=UPI00325FFA78
MSRLLSLDIASPAFPDWYINASSLDRQRLKALVDERWRLQAKVDAPLKDLQQDIQAFAKPLLSLLIWSNFNFDVDVSELKVKLYVPDRILLVIDRGASYLRESTLLEAALHNFEEPETANDHFRTGSGVYSKNFRGELKLVKAMTITKIATLCRRLNLGAQYQTHIKSILLPSDPNARQLLQDNAVAAQKASFNLDALTAYLKKDISEDAYNKLQQVRDNKSDITFHDQPLHRHRLSLMGFPLHGIVLFSAVSQPSRLKPLVDALTADEIKILSDLSHRAPVMPGDYYGKFKLLRSFFTNGPSKVHEDMLRREDIYQQNRLDGPVIAYVPDDPLHPLKEYNSLADFMKELLGQLRDAQYQAFFSRFVRQKDKGKFFARVNERLSRVVWQQREPLDMGPWWRETAVENPNAEPITNLIAGDLWQWLYVDKRDKAIADARVIAVPTGDEDAATRWKRLTSYLDIGWNVFNFVGMLIPGVGEVLLGVMVAQIADELLEGIEDWSKGDRDEAASHINGVLINFAQLALMGAGHVLPRGAAAVKPSALIDSLKPVELPGGKSRLWKPDVGPYEHPVALPANAVPNDIGLYEHGGKPWLRLEEKNYQVSQDPVTGQHRLEHPQRRTAYKPRVEHNNAGAWKVETEQPLEWDAKRLMRRLGYSADAFSDAELAQILDISGTHEGVLRKMHVENEPVPPLLADTLSRFDAYKQTERLIAQMNSDESATVTASRKRELFNDRYASQHASADPQVNLIKSRFTGIPTRMVEDLLAGASSAEREQMAKWDFADTRQTKPIPLRLAEALRNAQREVRLSRAYEGLYLDALLTRDTECLALNTLEALPGWPGNLRIEVREGSLHGELRASVGPEEGAERKVLLRKDDGRYETRDGEDNHLHGDDDLYAALQHALPDAHRKALGLPHVGQGPQLKQLIRQHALPRSGLRQALKMQPVKPFLKKPMREGDGRFGYPLSGRGQNVHRLLAERRERVRRLYPSYGNADIESVLAQAANAQAHPSFPLTIDAYLHNLELELERLKSEVQTWVETPSTYVLPDGRTEVVRLQDKQRVADLLRKCWQRVAVPEGAGAGFYAEGLLSLGDLRVGELPELSTMLFFHVPALDLSGMALRAVPDAFLDAFPRMRQLNLENNQLTSLPTALRNMRWLEAFDASNNQIALTPQTVAVLEECPALQQLYLRGNPLGRVPDFHRMPTLQQINLRRTALTGWPAGLDALPNLQRVDLRDNLITRVPADILNPVDEHAAAAARAFRRTTLDGNPLTPSALDDYAQTWMRLTRPPEMHVPMAPNGIRDPLANSSARLERWMRDIPDSERAMREEQWQLLEQTQDNANEFFKLLEDMGETAEYRNAYPDLQARVWKILDAATQSEELRTDLFHLAGDVETCADGASLIFSRLEVRNLANEGLKSVNAVQAKEELSTLAKGLFRLDEVERIAQQDIDARIRVIAQSNDTLLKKVERALQVDRVEIRLAYRIGLKDRLGLPGQPGQAMFTGIANVSTPMLDAAEQRVLNLDNSAQEFLATTQRDFWRAFLKNKYTDELLLDQGPLRARQDALDDAQQGMTSQEYKLKSDELKSEFNAMEQTFIERKTKVELPQLNAGQ